MLHRRQALYSLALVSASTLLWLGCQASQATELVAGISTQVQVPRDMQTIQIRVAVQGSTVFCNNYAVYDGHVELPRTLGTLPRQEAGTPVTISVVGYLASDDSQSDSLGGAIAAGPAYGCSTEASVTANPQQKDIDNGGGAKVLRVSRQPYSPDQILFLPMPIKYSCFDVDCGLSGGDQSCKAGQCVDSTIDQTKLDFYQDSQVYGGDATCFAVFGESACFASVATVPPLTVDDANCIYALPGATGAPPLPAGFSLPQVPSGVTLPTDGLNVRVYYDSGITNEILDLDADEGFTIPNAAQPQIFQLAPGLCQMVHGTGASSHRITSIDVNPICRPKLASQSICAADALAIVGANPDGTVSNPDGTCSVAQLTPATSAVEFVVDPTSNAADFYLAASGFVAKLTDPGLKNLSIGVQFMPDGNAVCPTASPLASHDLPLTLTTSPTLASYIQGLSDPTFGAQVAADSSPDLNVTTALTAAYADLKTNAGTAATKSVIVIAHSSLLQSCPTTGGQTPAAVITANPGVSTSVIALDGDTDCGNAALVSAVGGQANCLPTTAGSQTQQAILKEFTAAAACTYLAASSTAPDAIWFTDPTQPPSAATVVITPSTATNATATQCRASGSGFILANGDLILCKDSCDQYQNALAAAAALNTASNTSTPDAGTSSGDDGGPAAPVDAGSGDGHNSHNNSSSAVQLPTIIPLFAMTGNACVVPQSTSSGGNASDGGTFSGGPDAAVQTDAAAPSDAGPPPVDSGSGCSAPTYNNAGGTCSGSMSCGSADGTIVYQINCSDGETCQCVQNAENTTSFTAANQFCENDLNSSATVPTYLGKGGCNFPVTGQ